MKAENFNGNESQIAQDKEFIRHILEELKMVRTERWASDGERKFTPEAEFVLRRENNLEHVGAMQMIARKLFQKAKVEKDGAILALDLMKVQGLIEIHDKEEMYVGDSRGKDEKYYAAETEATARIKNDNERLNFGDSETALMDEYKAKETPESHFVKALDELQAWLHLISKRDVDESDRDLHDLENIKGYVYAKEFPTMQRIMEIVIHMMQRSELIKSPIPEMSEN